MPYRKYFARDKVLKQLVKQHGPLAIESEKNICLQICASIISQQLSTKVAAVIYNRFLSLFTSRSPGAAKILAIPHEELRSVGLSNAKAEYIKNVCRFFIEKKLTDAKLHKLSNEELVNLLTQIKGVGQWTVEMLLMFAMGREDVFSTGDFGLQKAMINLYSIEYTHKKDLVEQLLTISDNWRPYRSYACRYLWLSLDTPPL